MTPRRWYAIATLIMLIAVPALSSAATGANRLANPGCETASPSPFNIPNWTNFGGSPTPRPTARVDGIGNQGAACVVVGPSSLVSDPFPVTGGEEITTFTAFVWEIRPDDECSTGVCRSDSVVAVDFSSEVAGVAHVVNSFQLHCDDLQDARDNGAIDRSASCSTLDQYVFLEAKNASDQFECDSEDLDVIDASGAIVNHRCAKYDYTLCNHVDPMRNDEDCTTTGKITGCACVAPFNNPLLVGAGAIAGRISLGGALATDTAEPFIFDLGLQSPTTVTAFDDVFID